MKPSRYRQSRHQGQSTGRPGKAQLASFKEYNPRDGLGSHRSARDTGSMTWSGDGRGNCILGFQDGRMWADRIKHETLLLKMSQGTRLGIKGMKYIKIPVQLRPVMNTAVRSNRTVSQLVKEGYETNYSMFNSGKLAGF